MSRRAKLAHRLLTSGLRVRETLQHIVEREAADFLARREFLKGAQELRDELLGRHEQEDAIDSPSVVTDSDVVGQLERIGTQVVYLGHSPDLWLQPTDLQLMK